jgi:hypothetical protein
MDGFHEPTGLRIRTRRRRIMIEFELDGPDPTVEITLAGTRWRFLEWLPMAVKQIESEARPIPGFCYDLIPTVVRHLRPRDIPVFMSCSSWALAVALRIHADRIVFGNPHNFPVVARSFPEGLSRVRWKPYTCLDRIRYEYFVKAESWSDVLREFHKHMDWTEPPA